MYHPWRSLRALTDWTLDWSSSFPIHIAGLTHFASKTITLRDDMLYAERRCTIEHERLHAIRGPAPDVPALVAREEAAVDREAAWNLIGIRELGEALAWAHDLDEAADELAVDRQTLDTRLANLHPSERHYIRRRLATHHNHEGTPE